MHAVRNQTRLAMLSAGTLAALLSLSSCWFLVPGDDDDDDDMMDDDDVVTCDSGGDCADDTFDDDDCDPAECGGTTGSTTGKTTGKTTGTSNTANEPRECGDEFGPCEPDETCVTGFCAPHDAECFSDFDCPEEMPCKVGGWYCQCSSSDQCLDGGECLNDGQCGPPPPPCNYDWDCDAGFRCGDDKRCRQAI